MSSIIPLALEKGFAIPASHITALPVELLALIFEYFPYRRRIRIVSRVCKTWRKVVLRSITFLPLHVDIRKAYKLLPSLNAITAGIPEQLAALRAVLPLYSSSLRSLSLEFSFGEGGNMQGLGTFLASLKLPVLEALSIKIRTSSPIMRVFGFIGPNYSSQLTHLSLCRWSVDIGPADFKKLKSLCIGLRTDPSFLRDPPYLKQVVSQLTRLDLTVDLGFVPRWSWLRPYVTSLRSYNSGNVSPSPDFVKLQSWAPSSAGPADWLKFGEMVTKLRLHSVTELYELFASRQCWPKLNSIVLHGPFGGDPPLPPFTTLCNLQYPHLSTIRCNIRTGSVETAMATLAHLCLFAPRLRKLRLMLPELSVGEMQRLKNFLQSQRELECLHLFVEMTEAQCKPFTAVLRDRINVIFRSARKHHQRRGLDERC